MRPYKPPRESLVLDDVARDSASGAFVRLSDGMTHYRYAASQSPVPSDVPVVLIHGFSVPSFVWEPTFQGLVNAGFSVLCYDLFGRGYSDRPRLKYESALFHRQLRQLIKALDLPMPADLVGLSMGGSIAVGFAAQHPELVRRLVLIDPAGLSTRLPLAARLLQVPVLGEVLMAVVGRRLLVSGLVRHARLGEKVPAPLVEDLARQYLDQMQYQGFSRALLSTVRHGPLRGMNETYARVGKQGHPVLLIWGEEDRMVPFSLSADAQRTLPQAEFHAIQGAGHAPHLERPELINTLIAGFLTQA